MFMERQVSREKLARTIYHEIGTPPINAFKAILKMNSVKNLPIIMEDIKLSEIIFGPDIWALKGKTMISKHAAMVADYIDIPRELIDLYQEDILWIDGIKINGIFLNYLAQFHVPYGRMGWSANLMHDVTAGRSVAGILHLSIQTPIEQYSKKKSTVEKATYGSEFVAAQICVQRIIDVRNILRYLGLPIRDKSFMFGDNKSVVDSSMQLNAKLHKRHTMLSFHRVREAAIRRWQPGWHIKQELGLYGYTQIKERLKALLFWKGDTVDIKE
jgi:hypothetical protein